jgi:hypothetical protein
MSPVIEFVQAHDKVIAFQSAPLATQLVWDGVSGDGFKRITKKDPADTSTVLIPPAITAEHVGDQIFIIDGNEIITTDIADYTSYDKLLRKFYINTKSSDSIVRVLEYAIGIVIVFKSRSIKGFLDYTGDPTLYRVQPINSTLGLVGRKALVMAGDPYFLAYGGIYRIAQTFESRIETVPIPVTDPIQPLIDRINWPAAAGAVAELVDRYAYFFVPIDGATSNNCAIIINATTNLVEGYDIFPDGFRVDDVKVTLYQGQRRLFALDKANARIYVMYEGKSDFIYDRDTALTTEHPIGGETGDYIETRGYSPAAGADESAEASAKADKGNFKKVAIGVETWAPSLAVTELTEAAHYERPLHQTPITRDRLKYDRFAVKNWDPTNVNDDWATPGRQDYSILATDLGIDPGAGIDPDRSQSTPLKFATKCRGQYVSYRIANAQGAADVTSVMMESSAITRAPARAG